MIIILYITVKNIIFAIIFELFEELHWSDLFFQFIRISSGLY
jgi:hypothetical protein